MAELVIECPTSDIEYSNTAARGEPPTNSRIREFLKKHSSGSVADSGNSSDEQQRQVANRSPPPNCSICLGRVKSKCFTDSCMHQFCFSCLLEWSKVRVHIPRISFLFLFLEFLIMMKFLCIITGETGMSVVQTNLQVHYSQRHFHG